MKKYLILAASALALAGCSSDEYLGGENPGNESGANNAINFAGATGKITRATGKDAADLLNNEFVVYGYKTTGGKKATVYDYYTIKYDGKINQAEGNTQGWGYVGGTPNMLSSLKGIENNQSIKYWDYTASQYDFIAFSLGKDNAQQTTGDEADKVKVSTVNTDGEPTYSITGSVAHLAKCYIADRVTAKPKFADGEQAKNNLLVKYQNDVQFNFRSLATKVRLGLYETINGYSVKDVKFYTDANTKAENNNPFLYATGKTIPGVDGKGTMTIAFGSTDATATDFNQAKATWAATDAENDMSSNITFGELALRDKQSQEKTGTKFLGRSIVKDDVSTTDYQTTLPGTTVGALTLKVDYTLESIDGSGEEIKVTGATATIPAVYTQWKPNYAYTYIFRISDKTNGSTGTGDDPAGLYPITFDAIVTDTQDGQQNTITIVDDNSITTYAKGEQNNEYKTGSNIYVSISGQTLSAANTTLYTASLATPGSNIPESLVALCLKGTAGEDGSWTLDNNGNQLTVAKATGLEILTQIDAADTADGNAITGNFAKFKPATAGNYVIEYTYTVGEETKKAYKVIKVTE